MSETETYRVHLILVENAYEQQHNEVFVVKGYVRLQEALQFIEDIADEHDLDSSDSGFEVVLDATPDDRDQFGLITTTYYIEDTEIDA